METYVMATRLTHGTQRAPQALETLERTVMEHVRKQCPNVKWLGSYAVFGHYDYIDLFQAADNEEAARVAVLVRTFGHAHSEIWPAIEWQRFKDVVRDLTPGGAA